jgi:hypothetical protein
LIQRSDQKLSLLVQKCAIEKINSKPPLMSLNNKKNLTKEEIYKTKGNTSYCHLFMLPRLPNTLNPIKISFFFTWIILIKVWSSLVKVLKLDLAQISWISLLNAFLILLILDLLIGLIDHMLLLDDSYHFQLPTNCYKSRIL